MQANLAEAGECEAFVNEGAAALGRLDILVNMASIYVARPFSELTVDEFDSNVAVDLRSAFVCSRAAWPHMKRAGGGNIINFSDWLSRSGRPRYTGYLPYYVAKTGGHRADRSARTRARARQDSRQRDRTGAHSRAARDDTKTSWPRSRRPLRSADGEANSQSSKECSRC